MQRPLQGGSVVPGVYPSRQWQDVPSPEGIWQYKGNAYSIAFEGQEGGLVYTQIISGNEVKGKVNLIEGEYTWASELSNGARIQLALTSYTTMKSIYQRAGSSEWLMPVEATLQEGTGANGQPVAERRRDEDGNWYTQEEFIQAYGGTTEWEARNQQLAIPGKGKGKGKARRPAPRRRPGRGKETAVALSSVAAQAKEAFFESFVGDVNEELPLENAFTLRRSLMQAIEKLTLIESEPFDVLPPMPLENKMDGEALEDFRNEERVKENKGDPRTTIVPVPAIRLIEGLWHPVSYNEEQMIRLFVGDPQNSAYNLAGNLRCQVPLDSRKLRRSVMIISERHDVLRSAFRNDMHNDPQRKVEKVQVGECFTLCVRDESDTQKMFIMDQQTPHRLGITSMRSNLEPSDSGFGAVGINLHHVLADADGLGLFWGENMRLQQDLFLGFSDEAAAANLEPLPVQFTDFAYWQKSLMAQGIIAPDLAYWVNELVHSEPPMILDLPIDVPRPRVFFAVGGSTRVYFDQNLCRPLSEVVPQATPLACVFACFGIAMCRASAQPICNVAVPFALRSLPTLMNLIGNFLNMLPVRFLYDQKEPFNELLHRTAVSSINVQKYSFAPFVSMVTATQKQFAFTDPSRNPVYSSMIDLVPNSSEEPSNSLSGVMDFFIFVNTKEGIIWCLDGVYSTLVLQDQTIKQVLYQIPAIAYRAALGTKVPLVGPLPHREEVQVASATGITLTHVTTTNKGLPYLTAVKSGWEPQGATREYYTICRAERFKKHAAIELGADASQDAFKDLKPPGPPVAKKTTSGKPKAKPKPKPQLAMGGPTKSAAEIQAEMEAAAEAKRLEEVRERARKFEVACRSAEVQQNSELISLESDGTGMDAPEERWTRQSRRFGTGRGRMR